MLHDHRTTFEKLFSLLRLQRKQALQEYIDAKAREADLLWDAARFWAAALHQSDLPPRQTKAGLEAFREKYIADHGHDISITFSFEKHWLREVLGFVRIARNIGSALRTFSEIRDYKEELLFIKQLQGGKKFQEKITLSQDDLDEAIAEYEKEYKLLLNREGILYKRWSASKDGKIGISSLDNYYGIYLEYWTEFEFLFQWQGDWPDAEGGLLIPKKSFNDLRARFAHYTQFPTLQTFVEQKVVQETNGCYFINFWGAEPAYWPALCHRIAGLLWEELLNESSTDTDEERVLIFLQKTMRWNHWPDHLNYATVEGKKRFLDAAMNLLLTQNDLEGVSTEFAKLRLDSEGHRGAEVLFKLPSHEIEAHQLSGTNLFELYQSLHRLENKANITFLHHQTARIELTFLIRTIIKYDDEFARPSHAATSPYNRITQILREGLHKPFLLWKASRFIVSERPEIIAYLLTQQNLCTLGLGLLDEVEFGHNVEDMNREAWVLGTNLLLKSLPDADGNEAPVALIVFQLFRQLNRNKYTLPYNRNLNQERVSQEAHQKKETDVLALLENAPGSQGNFIGHQAPYLLPAVFNKLAGLFTAFEEKKLYRNGTVSFPMIRWDGMFWLFKLSSYWKFKDSFPQRSKAVNALTNAFLNQYRDILELKEVAAYDYFEGQEIQRVPLWSEKIERLERLDWFYPIYNLDRLGILGNFLAPDFRFLSTIERYDKVNEFTTDKLRTHLAILLQALRKMVSHTIPYGYEKERIATIKQRLEGQVIEYIRRFIVDDPGEGKVDLFSYRKEWMHESTDREALLPKLAQAINWFENKQAIIDAILSSSDQSKWLTLLEYVTAEGIKNLILERISQANLSGFLKQLSWLPEVQTVLLKLSGYPQLVGKFEETLVYWEELVEKNPSKENKDQLYLSRLLLAYMKNDGEALDAVPEPGTFDGSMSEMSYRAQKEFYKALLVSNSDPQQTYRVMDSLVYAYKDYPVISMNRMVAKMNMAAVREDMSLYWEAFEEWQTLKTGLYKETDLTHLEPNLSANLLEILYHLRNFKEQDRIFDELDLSSKMLPSILKIRVKSLVDEKRHGDALSLIATAKSYHQFADYKDIQFLVDLEAEVRGVDSVEDLKWQYNRIFDSAPGKLVKILPDAWNSKKDLYPFLVQEIVHAAGKLLEKIKSIENINLEDKYNDLIELVLDARLNGFGWQVGGQSRGAYSSPADGGPGKQPGERDIPIFDANKNVLLNCEALIYRGASNTPHHLQKVFNSHHQKEAFVILLYDTGVEKKGFDGNWNEYCKMHVPGTVYPTGAEITASLEEVTKEFRCNASAIKVGKSEHGSKTILYHVFVDIRYHMPLPKKPLKKPQSK